MSDNLNPVQFRGLEKPEYNKHYGAGWRSSGGSNASLDKVDAYQRKHGKSQADAWEDGYTDYAIGRDKFHYRDCNKTDHSTC